MAKKRLKNPKGGLTAAGRAFYKRTEGANLKPGVKNYSKASPADKKRWVRWALRFAGRSDIPPLKKPNGEPTRFALMFAAWGEPVPSSVEAVRRVYKKAQSRRDQLGMGSAKKKSVAMSDSGVDMENWDNSLAEIHLAGGEFSEDGQYLIKEILRTGEWNVIPTRKGTVKKPLRVVKEGKSDPTEGVIAMQELVENFKMGAVQNVQIPLSDDSDDHKNITRLNTGYVRDIWISEDENGNAKLVAKMEFTEPEVKEKIIRGTYSDVSCGIPWQMVSRGKRYGAALEHVAITNRPFIDGLGPFVTASDKSEDLDVLYFSQEDVSFSPGDSGADVKEGDIVTFDSPSDIPARHTGRVEHVMTDGVYGLKDSKFSVEASPENPALSIRLFKKEDGEWIETELTVGARASDVVVVNPAVHMNLETETGDLVVETPVSENLNVDIEDSSSDTEEISEEQIEAELDLLEEMINDTEDSNISYSVSELTSFASEALTQQLKLPSGYEVGDVVYQGDKKFFKVHNSIAETSWLVPFEVKVSDTSKGVTLASTEDWQVIENQEESEAPVADKTVAAPRQSSIEDELEAAQRLRQMRLSDPVITTEEVNMALSREELDRLDLSDEQRAAFQTILEENVALSAKAREAAADERISELEELGLKEKPGFLKLYREVMLSDDGGPAVILLSDGEEKEGVTALEILDRAIDALTSEGKVALSDQALVSGNDEKPPVDASEEISLDDRVAGVKQALGL